MRDLLPRIDEWRVTLSTMSTPAGNLFDLPPDDVAKERFDNLIEGPGFRVERIVSRGQASPEGFWYDQKQAEWVMVVQGRARLEIEGRPKALEMGPGDWVYLPARLRHRVEWTDPSRPTIWLAIHQS